MQTTITEFSGVRFGDEWERRTGGGEQSVSCEAAGGAGPVIEICTFGLLYRRRKSTAGFQKAA